jgi:ribonuclease-3
LRRFLKGLFSKNKPDPRRLSLILDLERKVGCRFRNLSLLEHALTHRSHVAPQRERSNERLEFLGDAVLGLTVCQHLFNVYPEKREGELTEVKSRLVSKAVLAERAREIDLGKYLRLSDSESRNGGRDRQSILADGYEALIAAIFLDHGLKTVREFVRREILDDMEKLISSEEAVNYKSQLQHETQGRSLGNLRYRLKAEQGPEHNKTFDIEVWIGRKKFGKGIGRTRKEAEQHAASAALVKLRSG